MSNRYFMLDNISQPDRDKIVLILKPKGELLTKLPHQIVEVVETAVTRQEVRFEHFKEFHYTGYNNFREVTFEQANDFCTKHHGNWLIDYTES